MCSQSVLAFYTLNPFSRPFWDGEMPVAFWLLVWQKQNSSNLFKFGWLLVACLSGSFSLSFSPKLWEVHQFQTSIKMDF